MGLIPHASVLVTGGTGFLGAHLVGALAEGGVHVVVLIRDRPLLSSLDLVAPEAPRTEVVGSVTDRDLLQRTIAEYEVEAVFHLAAQSQVGLALADPWETWETNVRGTYALFEAARRAKRPPAMYVASSDKAYGPSPGRPYREDDPLRPEAPYDASKAALEHVAVAYAKSYGIRVRVLRAANLYGGGDLNAARIVPETCRAILAGRRPVLRSDGSPRRDYMYVEDGVAAYVALANDERDLVYDVFNAGTGRETSVRVLVEALLSAAGGDPGAIDVRGTGTPRGEIDRQSLDASKIEATLGFRAATSLEEGARKTVAWYEAHRRDLARIWPDVA